MDAEFKKSIEGAIFRGRRTREEQLQLQVKHLDEERRRKQQALEDEANAILAKLPQLIETSAAYGGRSVKLCDVVHGEYFTNRQWQALPVPGKVTELVLKKLKEYEPLIRSDLHLDRSTRYHPNDSDVTETASIRVYFLNREDDEE